MIIYLKRLKSSKFVRVKAFPMYGGIGVSAPSLHRESTDSLIVQCTIVYITEYMQCNSYSAKCPFFILHACLVLHVHVQCTCISMHMHVVLLIILCDRSAI